MFRVLSYRKSFHPKKWHLYEENPAQGFDKFLEWRVDAVGAREKAHRDISDTQV
jgi:hypothetical protein